MIFKKKNKRKTNIKEIVQFSAIGLLGVMLFSNLFLWSQEIDPFYLKLLREGEKSFLNRNYKVAVEELEIAMFGLHGNKNLLAKAYIYIILSYRYLKNVGKCEEYVKKAVKSVNLEELNNLEIDMSIRNEFENLLNYFESKGKKEEPIKAPEKPQIKPPEKPPEKPQIKPPKTNTKPKEPEKKPVKTKYQELEERIISEPQNLTPYLELYELHRRNNDVKAARKVIQDLIKNNPEERIGFYFMGKIEFSQSNYADALTNFKQALRLSEKIQLENVVNVKTLIYISLCLYHLDRKELQGSFVKLIKNNTSDEQLRLMLKEEELEKEWENSIIWLP